MHQNEVYYSEKNQEQILKNWSKKLINKAEVIGGNVKQFIESHPLKDNVSVQNTKDWIRNM